MNCPHCTRTLSFPEEPSGQAFPCPFCEQPLGGSASTAVLVAPISALPRLAVSNEQVVSGKASDTELFQRVSKLAPPWRAIHSGLGRTHTAAWMLLAFQFAAFLIGMFWPPGNEGFLLIRTGLMIGLAAAQLATVLLHVMAQFRCTVLPPGEGRQAAIRSAWCGLAVVGVAFIGGMAPNSSRVYVVIVSSILVIFSAFQWQIFLRAIAARLGAHDLGKRIQTFTLWMWFGAASLLVRSSVSDRDYPAIGAFTAVTLLLAIAVYARLAAATAAVVAERAPIE